MEVDSAKSFRAPYKRKLTEARRAQNRDAQRKFRQKRKERLQIIESGSSGDHDETGHITATSQSSNSGSTEPFNTSSESSNLLSTGTEIACASTFDDETTNTLKTILKESNDPEANELLKFAIQTKPDLKNIILSGLCSLRDKEDHIVNDFNPSTLPDTEPLPIVPSNIPDVASVDLSPYSCAVFLRPRTVVEVWVQNARIIGLNPGDKIPKRIPSPWLSDSCSMILSSIWVPPDLYPTPAQLRYQHNACFDLLPFPWFRDRVARFAASDPPAFNTHELKMDIVRGGMICWASCSDVEYQSWDRRSWEVLPWFLEKWGWLIEYQGKVAQQSRLWRMLRES